VLVSAWRESVIVNCRMLIRFSIILKTISRSSTESSNLLYIRCFRRRFWKPK